jgi:hypothetical protein
MLGRGSWDTSVGIATGYGLDGILSNGYRGLYPRGYSGRGMKLTTDLHLVPRSRMVELYLYSPICLHGIVLN